MFGIPIVAALLILLGPVLIVGTIAAFASIDCPELRPQLRSRRPARTGWAAPAWA